MGQKSIVISGFRNRGQKSVDLVISGPRNNSASNLSELGSFDFWILLRTTYHMSPQPYCTWYDTCLLYTSPSPTTKNHTHIYESMPRLVCARQSFVLTQTRQQQQQHHRNHHTHTTAAAQQQHSSRDSSRSGGGLTSPATVYVPDFKNKGKRQK